MRTTRGVDFSAICGCPVWKIQSRNICEKIRFNDYVLKNFFGDRAKLKTGDLGKSV
jgi:hypothetical protein